MSHRQVARRALGSRHTDDARFPLAVRRLRLPRGAAPLLRPGCEEYPPVVVRPMPYPCHRVAKGNVAREGHVDRTLAHARESATVVAGYG